MKNKISNIYKDLKYKIPFPKTGKYLIKYFLVLSFYIIGIQGFSQNTKICGKLSNYTKGKKIYARTHFIAPLEFSPKLTNLDSSVIDSIGAFQLQFQQKISCPIELRYEKNAFELFLSPNDSVFARFQYPLILETISFSGTSSSENTFGIELKKIEAAKKKAEISYAQLNPQIFLQKNDSLKDFETKLLESKSTLFNKSNLKFFVNEINYNWANEHFLFIWKRYNTMIKAADKLPIDSIFFKFMDQVQISNDSALNSPAYFKFIDSYLNYMMPEYFRGSYIEKPEKNFFLMKFEKAEKILKGDALRLERKKIILEAESARTNQKTIRLMESVFAGKVYLEDK